MTDDYAKDQMHPRYRAWQAHIDIANDWITKLAGLCLGGMVLGICASVGVRVLFTYFNIRLSAPWGEEVARYLMVWSVFLGGAVAAGQGRLIGVEALVMAVPKAIARVMRVAGHVCSLLLFMIIAWQAVTLIDFGMNQTSPVMRLPMAWVYAGMLLGTLCMALNTVMLVAAELLGVERETVSEEEIVIDFQPDAETRK